MEIGNLESRNKGYKGKLNLSKLRSYIFEHPDAYQTDMAKEFNCIPAAICIALKKWGIFVKKDKTLQGTRPTKSSEAS